MKTKSNFSTILTAITVVASAVAFIAVYNASPDFYERHTEKMTVAYIASGLVFLWSAARLVLMGAKPGNRPMLLILADVGTMAACWFFIYSLPGIIVGGFIAVIGAVLSLRPAIK